MRQSLIESIILSEDNEIDFTLYSSDEVPLWYADYSDYEFKDGSSALILEVEHLIDNTYNVNLLAGYDYDEDSPVVSVEVFDDDYDYQEFYTLQGSSKESVIDSANIVANYLSTYPSLDELNNYLLSNNYKI